VLGERKPPPRPKSQQKVTRESNPDFRINPDTDPMSAGSLSEVMWIHFLVDVSHFAKYRKNWPLIA